MIKKGLFRLAILSGTLAGFYCNETTHERYFSECAMAAKDSPTLSHHYPHPPVAMYQHLHDSYDTCWQEAGEVLRNYIIKIAINSSNTNQFDIVWLNGATIIFKGIAQRHNDWLYGNYWEV